MKTFSTIFITGTFVSLIMITGNKEDFNPLSNEFHIPLNEEIILDENNDIPETELEIDFEALFHVEETPELTLDQIPYEEIEEEMIVDYFDTDVPQADLHIDFNELFEVVEEPELSLNEIEFLELEED